MKGMITMLKEYMNARYQRLSPVQCVFLVFTALSGLWLAGAATMPHGPATTGFFPFISRSGGDVKDEPKEAVLQWMKENSDMPEQVLAKVYQAAARTGNRDLILAICLVESNFNPHAISEKGAIGLMGVMPGVWLEELRKEGIVQEREDLYKISDNIEAGAYVLATYLSETNDLRKALIRYVGGASWYAARVMKAQKKIELAHLPERQLALAVGQD
jgi:hypothetical protein